MTNEVECKKCDWQLVYLNGSIGCLQAESLHDETPKIKQTLSSGKCDDFKEKN